MGALLNFLASQEIIDPEKYHVDNIMMHGLERQMHLPQQTIADLQIFKEELHPCNIIGN